MLAEPRVGGEVAAAIFTGWESRREGHRAASCRIAPDALQPNTAGAPAPPDHGEVYLADFYKLRHLPWGTLAAGEHAKGHHFPLASNEHILPSR